MKHSKLISIFFLAFLLLSLGGVALGDVSPGDIIDKSNWQKAEGLVSKYILEQVKNGAIALPIGELTYDPKEYVESMAGKLSAANKGKYTLNEGGDIVEKSTGAPPVFIEGIPFPDLSHDDPKFPEKFLWNRVFLTYTLGSHIKTVQVRFFTDKKFEREADFTYYVSSRDGYIGRKGESNPEGYLATEMYIFHEPYDVAGTAQLKWRFRKADKRDMLYAFVPSIRRVRRLSPANNSDAMLGSECCNDDSLGFNGKINDFEWSLVEITENLLPHSPSPDPARLATTGNGEYFTTPEIAHYKCGYETEGWPGVAWWQTNVLWVKRPTIILKAKSKDPYYNFGEQVMRFDADGHLTVIKDISDRSGNYWKSAYCSATGAVSDDGKVKLMRYSNQIIWDTKAKRATIMELASPRNKWTFFANDDDSKFSLSGFVKFCK